MTTAVLFAPESYVLSSPKVKEVINGCGPQGWKGCLVPDTIWGLSISEACNIHDWMYHCGETIADKEEADRVFLNNCLRLIEARGGIWFIKRMRMNRAYAYYLAVKQFGGPFFWEEKNPIANGFFVVV